MYIPGLRLASDRKSIRLNSSHVAISYAVFCLKKKNGIGPIGDAQKNEKSLSGHAVVVRERLQGNNGSRILDGAPVRVSGPRNQTSCVLLAQMQHHVGREYIAGTL